MKEERKPANEKLIKDSYRVFICFGEKENLPKMGEKENNNKNEV